MFEIKITLGDIDYAGAVQTLFPILKQKAENETALWAVAVRNMNMPDEETMRSIVNLLPQSVKDKIALELLSKYKDKIPAMLTSLAESHGIKTEVKDVVIEKV